MITLILGGARSGKSSFAEKLAKKISEDNVIYLATAEAKDEEMKKRIIHHQKNRPSSWKTIEEPLSPGEVLASISANETVLLDCITVLLSNLLFVGSKNGSDSQKQKINFKGKEEDIMQEIENIIVASKDKNVIIVSNEVGSGIVPAYKLGRKYRDIAGRVNQYLAKKAQKVYFTIAGIPVDLKQISFTLEDN